jgi:hypothetical protein
VVSSVVLFHAIAVQSMSKDRTHVVEDARVSKLAKNPCVLHVASFPFAMGSDGSPCSYTALESGA